VDLVADRFLVCEPQTTIDLASGDRVELVVSASGGVAEQARWAMRCDRFARLHHRSMARLLDYGPLGETRRFEAWRSDGRWRGSLHENERVRKHVADLFRASAWTKGVIDVDSIRQVRGRLVVLPDTTAGFDLDDGETDAREVKRLPSVSELALSEVSRLSVARIAEMFSDRFEGGCRTIALCGVPGSGRDTAVMTLARAARIRGYVPVAPYAIRPGVDAVLEGRSVALFIRSHVSQGWRALVHLSLVSRKPHIAVFVDTACPRGVWSVMLERVSVEALEAAVLPRQGFVQFRKRIRVAAKRARGWPGRFDALVWGEHDMPQSVDGTKQSRAAEPATQYEPENALATPVERGGRVVEWPAPGELATLRKRLQSAMACTTQGRHAVGDRTLRQVGASFARRHDWDHATEASLALAASLLRRGRPREAQSVLAETREMTMHVNQRELLNRLAVLTGLALTDDGRLDEAESVLTAAVAAARGLGEVHGLRAATLALARCQFWRGRFDSAVEILNKMDDGDLGDEATVRRAVLRSRLAVGQGDFELAIAQAASALDRARSVSSPELSALSACAVAFAHLSVGDHASVVSDVALAVQMARRAHDPLCALRARLIAAESHRRQGRRGPGLALAGRIRRLKSSPLPLVVRARADLLSGLLSPANNDDSIVVKGHAQTTGLAGLALFAPIRQSLSGQAGAVADIVTILQWCQAADEEARVLDGLCSRLRSRLQAAGVVFFVEEAGTFTPIASDGTRVEPNLAARVAAVDQPITPHFLSGRLEAGAPVRYGGRQLGVLLVRWSPGAACDSKDVVMLLATAATAAGPAVAGVLARRRATPRRSELIGNSQSIVDVRAAIERAAAAPFAVLVEGESGTGKELVARALHRQGPRRDRPFCALNCAALPDDLVESELFGHSRGAFTGALAERPGVFEEAHTGTLFLDEIGELSLRAQAKVLRTVQEGELRRVGENIPRRIDVRVVAATNRDLRQEVAAGRFRLDLLYRLDVIRIALPPLRARRGDIPLLAEHFWRDATSRVGSRASLSLATLAQLARYDWPGNVRELQNVLAALAVRTPRRGVVPPSALPPNFDDIETERSSRLDAARKTFDAQFIRAALARTGGHRARAAQELGVTRQGLTKLIVRLGLNASSTLNPEP
jgi:DNA-binding NtrC family response regulator/thioredoxin-like negative regulator of GroEL